MKQLNDQTRVLVTGATGFIGRHLVDSLAEKKVPLRLMCRSLSKSGQFFSEDQDIVIGDLSHIEKIREAMQGCDWLINVAGCYRFGPSAEKDLIQSNVHGLQNLLEIWKEADRSGRFIHVSTAGFWEQGDDGTFSQADLPDWSYYKKSKSAGEALVQSAIADGMDAVIVNPSCPIGEGDDTPTPTGKMIFDYVRGHFPVSCHTGINLIHINDLVEGILHAAESAPSGGPIIFGDENLWIHEILERLAKLTGKSRPLFTAPGGLVRIMGEIGEAIDTYQPGFTDRTQLCRETAWLSGRTQFFSLDQQYRDLGWKPKRGVDQALRESVGWYQQD
ncbi:MAG: NAD-dependent epimerase/dehydratase family protein [Verrucomicrobiota bacterium]